LDEYLLAGGSAWVVLQILALWLLPGWWRKAAWPPAIAMGCAIVIAALGVLDGSDLAPIWVVLALPVCLAWIATLWIVRGVSWFIAGAMS
jgi:hypothetical protein